MFHIGLSRRKSLPPLALPDGQTCPQSLKDLSPDLGSEMIERRAAGSQISVQVYRQHRTCLGDCDGR